ncbi:MAG TPA: diacylglycerol kinase family protein [Candidatus Polarisedimenticolia bacterium]|nr:diacylglycerol kinase family protein [Candidatus Polarisedimenticolia bacterium]
MDSATLDRPMRAAAIFGLGCSPKNLKAFQTEESIDWRIGLPSATDQVDIILLFGGDGTIHRQLSQLVKLKLPVLIVPVGSGNDFASALGIRGMRDSLAAWRRYCSRQNNVRAIDLGVITPVSSAVAGVPPASDGPPQYFCSVAGIGLDAEVSRLANKLPRWLRRHGGYALALTPTIFRFASFPAKITLAGDGGIRARSNQPTILAAFANTSTYGGGMKIAPHAQMDDGYLDVCVIGRIDPFKLACMFPTVYFGRHLRIPEVDYFRAARLRVETEAPLEIYADGEYVCRTPADIGVHGGALKMLTL